MIDDGTRDQMPWVKASSATGRGDAFANFSLAHEDKGVVDVETADPVSCGSPFQKVS
jgi:hypothetical protein